MPSNRQCHSEDDCGKTVNAAIIEMSGQIAQMGGQISELTQAIRSVTDDAATDAVVDELARRRTGGR